MIGQELAQEAAVEKLLTEAGALRAALASFSDDVTAAESLIYPFESYEDYDLIECLKRAKEHVDSAWRSLEYAANSLQNR